MERIIDVAAYIIKKYQEVTGTQIDEMKLHKLLYFTQRETIAILGHPAFSEVFEGWKYGPVSREVRSAYYDGEMRVPTSDISDEMKYIVNNIIYEYGALESWKLSELSHRDTAWRNSRQGLSQNENGNRILSLEDITADAAKIRPYDHVWDMYYDEFDTEEVLP